MKTKQGVSKAAVVTGMFGLATTALQAQDFKSTINNALNEYLLPVVALGILVGAIVGLFRNWDDVNRKETRKEGLLNAGIIVLYAALIAGVIVAVIAIASRVNLSI